MFRLFFTNRFFTLAGLIAVGYALSFGWAWLYPICHFSLIGLMVVTALEIFILELVKGGINAERQVDDVIALGEANLVELELTNLSGTWLNIELIDELPVQLQVRDFSIRRNLKPHTSIKHNYQIYPKSRGIHEFGFIQILCSTRIGLSQKRIIRGQKVQTKVYPSFPLMRAMELHGLRYATQVAGNQKIRRLGHSYEFDHIKSYVAGDDVRHINWKASSRGNGLMVNHFEEEKGQHIYSIIDKSRLTHLSFNQMRFLDYSINTALALANLVLKKRDRAGLITFDNKVDTFLPANSDQKQLLRIVDSLYAQQTYPMEADFERLYLHIKQKVRTRSLLVLYTNFESIYSIEHALSVFRRLHQRHLLLVVMFKNDQVHELVHQDAQTEMEVYQHIVARKLIDQKEQMIAELSRQGIHSILTSPEDLAIKTVEQYLQFKQSGLI